MKQKELEYLKSEVDIMASHATIPINRDVLAELIEQYELAKGED